MEIDKKTIKKLIEVLEDLKKSLKDNKIINSDDLIDEKIAASKVVTLPSEPWIIGKPFLDAICLDSILFPMLLINWESGPINFIPCLVTISAKL